MPSLPAQQQEYITPSSIMIRSSCSRQYSTCCTSPVLQPCLPDMTCGASVRVGIGQQLGPVENGQDRCTLCDPCTACLQTRSPPQIRPGTYVPNAGWPTRQAASPAAPSCTAAKPRNKPTATGTSLLRGASVLARGLARARSTHPAQVVQADAQLVCRLLQLQQLLNQPALDLQLGVVGGQGRMRWVTLEFPAAADPAAPPPATAGSAVRCWGAGRNTVECSQTRVSSPRGPGGSSTGQRFCWTCNGTHRQQAAKQRWAAKNSSSPVPTCLPSRLRM